MIFTYSHNLFLSENREVRLKMNSVHHVLVANSMVTQPVKETKKSTMTRMTMNMTNNNLVHQHTIITTKMKVKISVARMKTRRNMTKRRKR